MERVFTVVRYYSDKLWSLDGRLYTEGVEYRDELFIVYPRPEDAIVYARDFAEIFPHIILYQADAEILPVVPCRYPTIAAPHIFRQQWSELVLAGKIHEAEQLCLGEWRIYTYPSVGIAFATVLVLERPLIRFKNYFEPSKRQRRVVTVLDPNLAEVAQEYCYGWEVKVHGGDQVSV